MTTSAPAPRSESARVRFKSCIYRFDLLPSRVHQVCAVGSIPPRLLAPGSARDCVTPPTGASIASDSVIRKKIRHITQSINVSRPHARMRVSQATSIPNETGKQTRVVALRSSCGSEHKTPIQARKLLPHKGLTSEPAAALFQPPVTVANQLESRV